MSKKGPLRHCLLDRFFFLYLSHNFGFPFFSFSFAYLPECSPSSILQTSMGVPKQPQGLESPLDCKEIQPVYPKGNQSWMFIGSSDEAENSNTLATWCEELTHWKRPWSWERLKAGEGVDRGWDGWMASPTQWVWASSRSWWWTRKPGVLQSMGSQSVRHDWVTDLTDWSSPMLLTVLSSV